MRCQRKRRHPQYSRDGARLVTATGIRLEADSRAHLNPPRVADSAIPFTEVWISQIGCESRTPKALIRAIKDMPIPEIKEFSPYLKPHSFTNHGFFEQSEVLIVVTETPQIRDSRPAAVGEVEGVSLEGILVEEKFIGIKAALVLGKRIGSRFNCRDAPN